MLLLWHLKSYLPAHSILRGFVALHLCNFADAIRAGCAEAKDVHLTDVAEVAPMQSVRDISKQTIDSCYHEQNNEVNRKESYPIQPLNQIALFYE